MKPTFAGLFVLILTTGVFAQAKNNAAPVAAGQQVSQNILETEKELDQEIFRLNEQLTRHTPLLKMKLVVLPYRTLVFKGKDNGESCELNPDQTDPANNCLRVEVYDFILDEYLYPTLNRGSKYKYIELFYSGQSTNNPDPSQEPPRKLTRLRGNVYSNDFFSQEKMITDVIDSNPNGQPSHDDQITLFSQRNGFPEKGRQEDPKEKGVGVFKLSNVENTKTNQVRNKFKQSYYVKYLDYFNRLLSKIYDYNDRDVNTKYKETVKILKESLDY